MHVSHPLHLARVILRKSSTVCNCVSLNRVVGQPWRYSPSSITAALRRLLCPMSPSTCGWDCKRGKMLQTGQTSTPVSLLGFSQLPAKPLQPLHLAFPMQDRPSLGKFVLHLIARSTGRRTINLRDFLYHFTVIVSVSNYLCTLGTAENLFVNHC